MNDNLISITALIDGSGSMMSMKQAVLDGFNEFIIDQRKLPGTAIMSVYQFNYDWMKPNLKTICHFRNIHEISLLTKDNYTPNGGTPLLWAMDNVIDELGQDLAAMPEHERPSKVLLLTITDGLENSSDPRKYSKALLKQKIEHQRTKYSWNFAYIGSNQDSFAEGETMGIDVGATMDFMADYKGLTGAIRNIKAATTRYRTGATKDFKLPVLGKDDTN